MQNHLKDYMFVKLLSAFTDDLKNTTRSLQADIGEYETNQLKISATISSLELFRINQTLSKCGKSSFHKVGDPRKKRNKCKHGTVLKYF